MTEALPASSSRRRNQGYTLTSSGEDVHESVTTTPKANSSSALLPSNVPRSLSRHRPTLVYCCYGLHAFFVVLHLMLVWMSFTHPEHRFSVSINNTVATIALKASLQAFYSVYTAVLVLITQRLAISAAMSKRQKLTAVHDISGAWNGIGTAVSALWQQTKIISAPLAILLAFAYLGCISVLHIISSSVIQFEAFNNTITTIVPSMSAWPSPSVDLQSFTWETISPLLMLWPLFSTAKGLSGNNLYDVPSAGYVYVDAVVEVTTLTAECGLLSNLSAGTLDTNIFNVNISGLGEVGLPVPRLGNSVNFFDLVSNASGPAVGYLATTVMELGNLTNKVIKLTGYMENTSPSNIPTTSHYVACTINASSHNFSLPMQNGVLQNSSLLPSQQSESWIVWSSTPSTNLTQMFNAAQDGLLGHTIFETRVPVYCQSLQLPIAYHQCTDVSLSDIYVNSLLGIQWTYEGETLAASQQSITAKSEMENAIAQLAATFMWLAGAAGIENGGFQQTTGESLVTSVILELRPNVNIAPAIMGLAFSLGLLIIVIWMFYDFYPMHHKRSVTSAGLLDLMWIYSHSNILQEFMKQMGSCTPDQLRLKGAKAEVCLSNVGSQQNECQDNNNNMAIHLEVVSYAPKYQETSRKGNFLSYWLCYIFHILLLAIHTILILLLKHHPEHNVTVELDNTWVAIALSILLQGFYVVYTAGLLFITQQLTVSVIITKQLYLTAVHDISQAWTGVGAAVLQTLWFQVKTISSFWMLLGVTTYLACITVLHITSATIMQFVTFNSTSIIPIQSTVTWPNNSLIANGSWIGPYAIVVPDALLENLETVGLVNNTIYDIVNTSDPTLAMATVNATSIQANCGLLSNLTFSNSSGLQFSINETSGGNTIIYTENLQPNQIFFLEYASNSQTCEPCFQYLYFLITTNVELDEKFSNNTPGLNINLTNANGTSVMTYLAACVVTPQAGFGTLDLQSDTLVTTPFQAPSQSWTVWSELPDSSNIGSLMIMLYQNSGFAICPQLGFAACSTQSSVFTSPQNDTLYTVTPNQIQQSIERSVAAAIWSAGKLGPYQGGFECGIGTSPVTQVITKWRLNINPVPVIVASVTSLIMLTMVGLLIGVPFRVMQPCQSITGLSTLEILWVAAHSCTICHHMAEVDEPSMDNLRKAGMFSIRLADVGSTHAILPGTEGEALLEPE